jgi:vanillate O-demethylase ferredoxin subunit
MTGLPDASLLSLTARVANRWTTACDVVALRLVRIGAALPDVEAGAHIDVETTPGLVRQYSLTNQPGPASDYVIGVKLEPAPVAAPRRYMSAAR